VASKCTTKNNGACGEPNRNFFVVLPWSNAFGYGEQRYGVRAKRKDFHRRRRRAAAAAADARGNFAPGRNGEDSGQSRRVTAQSRTRESGTKGSARKSSDIAESRFVVPGGFQLVEQLLDGILHRSSTCVGIDFASAPTTQEP
jgi:hypothetical protein